MREGATPDGRTGEAPRERARRTPVMIPATIRCPDGEAIACVLRDMSASGAKLSVSRRHGLPQAFTLAVQGHARDYPVRRVWRRGDFTGVALDLPGAGAAGG